MEQITQQQAGAVMVVLPQSELDAIKDSISDLKGMIKDKALEEANSIWMESEAARKLLGVSPRTWQAMRDRRELPFSQYGRKIYVCRGDIERFLNEHRITKNRERSHE